MADGGASNSECSDISGIDEYIPDHFDGETDGFRHMCRLELSTEGPGLVGLGTVPGCQTCLASRTKQDLKASTLTERRIRVGN